jgi:hypothetical protein
MCDWISVIALLGTCEIAAHAFMICVHMVQWLRVGPAEAPNKERSLAPIPFSVVLSRCLHCKSDLMPSKVAKGCQAIQGF